MPEPLINRKLIELDLLADTKEKAIAELAEMLYAEGKLSDLSGFIEHIHEREQLMSTYCGYDTAMPHAESPFVKEPAFAFGRTRGFLWDEKDTPVNFIFLLAIPETSEKNPDESKHIQLMSSIAFLVLEDKVREIWLNTSLKKDITDTFLLFEQLNKI